MKNTIILSTFILFCNLTTYSQISVDTLYYKKVEIRVYTYLLHQDTAVHAYFDQNTPRKRKKIKTNIGRLKFDMTLEGIIDFLETKYRSPLVAPTDMNIDKPLSFSLGDTPHPALLIAKDSYCIGAISYYQKELEKNSRNYLPYYELAKAYDAYKPYDPSIHDKVIAYLETCINLNPAFEEAYVLKARTHEKNGKWKGIMMSEPHVDIVDIDEIKEAIKCLDDILLLNPANREAQEYLAELKDRYGKNYKL